ncbi:unnamed protein product [Paramecium sonneborni]|uniref:Uncharacterized protein n=1 Tax=Paramecium sonneborni TaxID=65129 RepID=A0A8S1RPU1_9CILI|nr:unnamed protein product [Paramecium sonneborni]
MIYGNLMSIQVQNFKQGRLKLSNKYEVHTDAVTCLVYSKFRNSFVSGSQDNTIICLVISNQKIGRTQNNLNTIVIVFIVQFQIKGGLTNIRQYDKSLTVQKLDFRNNLFLYSLNRNLNNVWSFNFNEAETVLVSCEYDEFNMGKRTIRKRGIQIQNIYFNFFIYKQKVKDEGYKSNLINDQQFILVTSSKNIDGILVFEQQNGIFKLNSTKTIKLIQNNQNQDQFYFPIIYNKNRKMILLRNKNNIYLIKKLNDVAFKIVASLKCKSEKIFGTMVNNQQFMKVKNQNNYHMRY